MEKRVIFSAPAALSFIFMKVKNSDLLKTGSIGIGCTIDQNVTADAEKAKRFSVFFNGEKINFPTVRDAVKLITNIPVNIRFTSSLPLGYGFGLSGAGSLASVFAVNQLLNLGISKEKLTEYAHIAEIKNGTGLGTVGTVQTGGFLVKTSAGIPFKYYSLPFIGKKLYVIIIDKLFTPGVLRNEEKLDRVEKAGTAALERIRSLHNPSLEDILDVSYEFVTKSLLVQDTRVHDLMQKLRHRKGHATMAILGNVVITTEKPDFEAAYIIKELKITDGLNS